MKCLRRKSSSSHLKIFFTLLCISFLFSIESPSVFAQQTTISIDPSQGQDVASCGINATATPCKSLNGAVQVALNSSSESFIFALASGLYGGVSNTNISIPNNVVKIGGQPLSTIIDVDANAPAIIISANLSVSDLAFQGSYGENPVLYFLLPASSEVSFSNIDFLNISSASSLVSGSLASASSLQLNYLYLSPDVASSVTILTANAAEAHKQVCDSSYIWPSIEVNNITAQNLTVSNGFLLTDTSFSLSNSQFDAILSIEFFINVLTTCDTLSISKPSFSISQVEVTHFSTSLGPIIQSNSGPTSLQNLLLTSYYPEIGGSFPAIELSQPTSLNLDSLELSFGSGFSSGLALNWYCVDTTTCSQDLNNNILTNLNIHDNFFLGLFIEVNSPLSGLSDSSSSSSSSSASFVSISLIDSIFTNNQNTYNLTDSTSDPIFTSFGAGITATYWGPLPSSPSSSGFNGTLLNYLFISNTTFSYNSALNGGGALVLQSFIGSIDSSTFLNNSASNQMGIGGSDMQSSCWDQSDVGSFGGGAILASYQTTLYLSNHTVFNSNFVEGRISTTVPYRMAGAVHCCSGSLSSVTVHSDGTTSFLDNMAPMVDNIHCTNVTWRKPLPTCSYIGSDMKLACDSAPLLIPVWVLVFIMLGSIVLGTGCVIFYKRRKKRIEGYSKL